MRPFWRNAFSWRSSSFQSWGPVPRCVVTTQDPATGVKDFDTLKRIAEYRPLMQESRGIPFGMYAEVERPGRVAVGDPVEPLGA